MKEILFDFDEFSDRAFQVLNDCRPSHYAFRRTPTRDGLFVRLEFRIYCRETPDNILVFEETANSVIPNAICRSPYTKSSVFIDSPSFSSHSGHNSQHGKLKQIFSSRSRNGSIPGDLHRSQLRSFSSLLLSRKMMYFVLIALKYVKVRGFNTEDGMIW